MQVPSLRPLREAQFITREELAVLAKVSANTIYRLEGGQSGTIRTVKKLARALKVPPQRLVDQAVTA